MKLVAFTRIGNGSLGIVTDTLFIGCYWPKLDGPTSLFDAGSSGIAVMYGVPRNVLFPEGTEFREYLADAIYPAEQAVMAMSPGRRGLVNLTDEEAAAWLAAYEKAAAELPPTAARHPTRHDCFFLRNRVEKSRRWVPLNNEAGGRIQKIEYDEFVAEVPAEHARKPHAELRAKKHHNAFIGINEKAAR